MSLQQLRNVNFGKTHADITGSSGVGYAILDQAGGVVAARTTTGVYQLAPGSGLYAAYVNFPDAFRGQLLWDCPAFVGSLGPVSQSWATEQFNVEENDPRVNETLLVVSAMTGTLQSVYDISFGRWKIDKTANQMLFYGPDNSTLIARFDLFDDAGAPNFDGVFERRKV